VAHGAWFSSPMAGSPPRKSPNVARQSESVVSRTCQRARVSRARRAWAAAPRRIGSAGIGRAAACRPSVRPGYRRIHDTRIKVHPIVRSGIGRYILSQMRPSSVSYVMKKNPAPFHGNRNRAAVPPVFPGPETGEGPAQSAWLRQGLRPGLRRRVPRRVAYPVHSRAGGECGDDAVATKGVGGVGRSQRVRAAAEHRGVAPPFPRCSIFAARCARGPGVRCPSVLSPSASSGSFQFV
jgi:hypothetical protein